MSDNYCRDHFRTSRHADSHPHDTFDTLGLLAYSDLWGGNLHTVLSRVYLRGENETSCRGQKGNIFLRTLQVDDTVNNPCLRTVLGEHLDGSYHIDWMVDPIFPSYDSPNIMHFYDARSGPTRSIYGQSSSDRESYWSHGIGRSVTPQRCSQDGGLHDKFHSRRR